MFFAGVTFLARSCHGWDLILVDKSQSAVMEWWENTTDCSNVLELVKTETLFIREGGQEIYRYEILGNVKSYTVKFENFKSGVYRAEHRNWFKMPTGEIKATDWCVTSTMEGCLQCPSKPFNPWKIRVRLSAPIGPIIIAPK